MTPAVRAATLDVRVAALCPRSRARPLEDRLVLRRLAALAVTLTSALALARSVLAGPA